MTVRAEEENKLIREEKVTGRRCFEEQKVWLIVRLPAVQNGRGGGESMPLDK